MPFFYILYILIKKILKILYWGRNLQGRTGKGPKPLAFPSPFLPLRPGRFALTYDPPWVDLPL